MPPQKGPVDEARKLKAEGKSNPQIANALNYSERTISRWLNEKPLVDKIEDDIQAGRLERAAERVPGSSGTPAPLGIFGRLEGPMDLDRLAQLGVPTARSPFVLAAIDLAEKPDASVLLAALDYWRYSLWHLDRDPETPWDVCVDLGLARHAAESWSAGDPMHVAQREATKRLLELFWRYRPWKGAEHRGVFLAMLKATMDAAPKEDEPDSTRAEGWYPLILKSILARILSKYVTGPEKLPLSLLLRGRRSPTLRQLPGVVAAKLRFFGYTEEQIVGLWTGQLTPRADDPRIADITESIRQLRRSQDEPLVAQQIASLLEEYQYREEGRDEDRAAQDRRASLGGQT